MAALAPTTAVTTAHAVMSANATVFRLPMSIITRAPWVIAVTAEEATVAVARPAATPAAARTVASSHTSETASAVKVVSPNSATDGS